MVSGSDRRTVCGETEVAQFATQRGAGDAEDLGGARLVALGMAQHHAQQRLFHFADHALVETWAAGATQVAQVVFEGALRVAA